MPDSLSTADDLKTDAAALSPVARVYAPPPAKVQEPSAFLRTIVLLVLLIASIAAAVGIAVLLAPFLQGIAQPGLSEGLKLAILTAGVTALCVLPIAMISERKSAKRALKPFLKLRADLDAAKTAEYPQLGRYATNAANEVAKAINSLSANLRERDIELESRRRRFDYEAEDRMAEIKDAYASMEVSLKEAERVRREAERANYAKSDFLAKMSHEIRTPLNGIMGAMDLMLTTGLNARQQNYATTIRASGATLLDLLNGILDLAKIESGEIELVKEDYDPTGLLDDIAIAFAPVASKKGLRVFSKPDPDLPHLVIGDPARVRQIIVNLVGNAVKFTNDGSVSIITGWKPNAKDDSGIIEIDVTDTGPGVPEVARDRIFDRFEQGDGSMSRKFGGAGLGLAIARDLARRLGGDVTLQRSRRTGSTFRLSVPAILRIARAPSLSSSVFVLAAEAGMEEQQGLLSRLARIGVDVAEAAGAAGAADALAAAAKRGDRMPDVVLVAGEDFRALQRLRSEFFKIAADYRPKLCVLTDFGAEAVPEAFDDIIDWAMMRPLSNVDLAGMMKTCADGPVADAAPAEPLGLDVLMAEDNPVNVLVTQGLLEELGCTVQVVGNGLAATDAVASKTYDVILMDCQMPIMDGYEATRQIRALEESGKRTPIIAVTANAFAEDREACFGAGMNQFLAKPLTTDALTKVLRPYAAALGKIAPLAIPVEAKEVKLERDAPKVHKPAPRAPALDDKSAVIDAAAWKRPAQPAVAAYATGVADDGFPAALDYDVIQALRKVGRDGDKMVQRVIDTYLKSSPGLATELAAAAKVGDLTAAGRHAHALKSASGNVGSRALPTMLADIQARAKAGDAAAVERLAAEVNTAFEDLTMALNTLKARG